MEIPSTDYSSLGKESKNSGNSAEEYTKLLRRRMISEVLQKPQNNDVWQLQQERSSRKNSRHRPQRRSHSAQGRRSETQSEVNLKPSPQKGLGRRSVTQLELTRKKEPEEKQKTKWHSQENLDKVGTTFF